MQQIDPVLKEQDGDYSINNQHHTFMSTQRNQQQEGEQHIVQRLL